MWISHAQAHGAELKTIAILDFDLVDDQHELSPQPSNINGCVLSGTSCKRQILKNFPGSLKGHTKLEIAQECYFLGLRTIRALLNIIEQNRDDIIAHVVQNVLATESGDSDAKDRKAKRIMSGLIELISVAIIKKISGSVGSESLSQTYEEVLGKHNTLAVQLIDLSVKLDHFRAFPNDEFAALIDDNQKALFPTLILRSLALNHFYRFPVQREDKQRVCGKLGIEIKTVNLLEQKRLRS